MVWKQHSSRFLVWGLLAAAACGCKTGPTAFPIGPISDYCQQYKSFISVQPGMTCQAQQGVAQDEVRSEWPQLTNSVRNRCMDAANVTLIALWNGVNAAYAGYDYAKMQACIIAAQAKK